MYWKTLSHNGPIFPKSYKYQDAYFAYDNKQVLLTKPAEHYAVLYAKTKDYFKDPIFNKNFLMCWKKYIPPFINDISKCDFSKLKTCKLCEYPSNKKTHCVMNDKSIKMTNVYIEPTCIFKGRGNHPMRGFVKEQVNYNDVIINASYTPRPEIWKSVICDPSHQWLATYKDTMGTAKYVFAQNLIEKTDQSKFDFAKKLTSKLPLLKKKAIDLISSHNSKEIQLGCAILLLLKLNIRVGNEKPENTADTMGCCTLTSNCFTFKNNDCINLTFVGKDSITYNRTFNCMPLLYEKLKVLSIKSKNNQFFPDIDSNYVNNYLKSFMSGLTAKVIRTCNTSLLFQKLLHNNNINTSLKFHYDSALTKAAILCNHVKTKNNKIITSKDTTKLNYIDPRITIAFAKKNNKDISTFFSKSQEERHKWDMNTPSTFVF